MTELTADQFSDFFTELYSYSPFPWQARLAHRVASGADWPEAIDVPTGAGKTACIDIALFALACQAEQDAGERSAPRRIFFVVDRRIIVDEAFERARCISGKLAAAKTGVLRRVAERLRGLSGSENPLACVQLRGGIYRDDQWVRNPVQPTVIASTVDQIGSRLLYRGYGLRSGYTAPIHAGLVANDALIILDEAHCANPFRQTLAAIDKYRGWAENDVIRSPFIRTILSATPPVEIEETFSIGDEDRAHPVLKQRIEASKPASLKVVSKAKGKNALEQLSKAMSSEINVLLDKQVQAIGVIVNRVDTARMVYRMLAQNSAIDCVLLTGRMRPIDKDAVVGEWLDKLQVRTTDQTRELERPVVVVATQTLEVGANLDFDALVTECAGLDALRQRFGRLNRGGQPINACGVILIRGDQIELDKNGDAKNPDPVYGSALARTWRWLTDNDQREVVDFGIEEFRSLLPVNDAERRELLAPLSTSAPDAPVLMPSHLDMLVQTAPRPTPDPDVSVFLHGPRNAAPEVMVCWRADLTKEHARGEGIETSWIDAIALCPPTSAECMPVPLRIFRAWLRGESIAGQITDVEAEAEFEAGKEIKFRQKLFVRWFGPEDEQSSVHDNSSALRPGDTVVLPETAGGWETFGHVPGGEEGKLIDQAERAGFELRRHATLRLHQALMVHWPESKAREDLQNFALQTEAPESVKELREQLAELAQALEADGSNWLATIAGHLSKDARLRLNAHPCGGWVLKGSHRIDTGTVEQGTHFSDEDTLSSSTVDMKLENHLEGVGAWAHRFATKAGLPEELVEDVVLAARLHDLGKADPRFQALLHNGNPWLARAAEFLLAKSSHIPNAPKARREARRRSGYPKGARHELLSVRLTESAPAVLGQAHDIDLVLHLVASHHGRCRPFAPVVKDEDNLTVTLIINKQMFSADSSTYLERIDSGVPERFWLLVRRYGWWGIAWLETLMRLADWNRSEEEQRVVSQTAEKDQSSKEVA